MMGFAIVAAIPAAWIVLVPTDPSFHPELTANAAWATLAICGVLAYIGQVTARKARARFDQMIYQITRLTREAAMARGYALEIDLGETYPPALLSRQHRILGFAGPVPLFVPMEQVVAMKDAYDVSPGMGVDPQPHLIISLSGTDPASVSVIPARGFGHSSMDHVRTLHERLTAFLDPSESWDTTPPKTVDVAAFIESMRPR
jgi:hypothetical protein